MGEGRQGRPPLLAEAILEAAQISRTTPLLGDGRESHEGSDPRSRGWFNGPAECARLLASLTGGAIKEGWAFGGSWPWVDVAGAALGPAIPVAVVSDEAGGPDGAYRRVGECVFREAGGRERPLVAAQASNDTPTPGVDVLWFGDGARHLVRAGVLEVEDLFSRLLVAPPRAFMEHWLVRRLRCHPDVLAKLGVVDAATPETTIEVARARAVTAATWSDPEAFFRIGIGFATVTVKDTALVARGVGRQPVEYAISGTDDGWCATLIVGAAPFASLCVERDDQDVVLRAAVSPEIDPLAAGVRERLTFDLRSYLVSL